MLADRHDRACRQLAGPAQRAAGPGTETSTTPEGAVLLDEAVVSFDCTVHQEVVAGDHTIVLLRLHGVSDPGRDHPLVFHRSGFGGSPTRADAAQNRIAFRTLRRQKEHVMVHSLPQRLAAEAFGMFWLVFGGCGAAVFAAE